MTMRLVSSNHPDQTERSLLLTNDCVDLIYDALAILSPDSPDASRKKDRILAMIDEHRWRNRARRILSY